MTCLCVCHHCGDGPSLSCCGNGRFLSAKKVNTFCVSACIVSRVQTSQTVKPRAVVWWNYLEDTGREEDQCSLFCKQGTPFGMTSIPFRHFISVQYLFLSIERSCQEIACNVLDLYFLALLINVHVKYSWITGSGGFLICTGKGISIVCLKEYFFPHYFGQRIVHIFDPFPQDMLLVFWK